jgi:hypothetical protein
VQRVHGPRHLAHLGSRAIGERRRRTLFALGLARHFLVFPNGALTSNAFHAIESWFAYLLFSLYVVKVCAITRLNSFKVAFQNFDTRAIASCGCIFIWGVAFFDISPETISLRHCTMICAHFVKTSLCCAICFGIIR